MDSTEDSWRVITRIVKAANEAGIDFEQAMRFITAFTLLVEADKGGHKAPERAQ